MKAMVTRQNFDRDPRSEIIQANSTVLIEGFQAKLDLLVINERHNWQQSHVLFPPFSRTERPDVLVKTGGRC
jgi:hypothetical protein